jgi:hypothetical protein
MTPEGRVKAKVTKALKSLGTDVWRFMPVQSGYGTPALDYLLCIRGRFVAIETKAPGNKLTPQQEGTKAAMEAAGGIVLVVWDETSLDIAMKIILALEFAPYGTSGSGPPTISPCLRAAETPEQRKQHLCKWVATQEVDAPIGGDHRAPGTAPNRQPKPGARR